MLDVYATIGLWAVGFGILVIVVSPLIKKLMHLDTLRDADDGWTGLTGQTAGGGRPSCSEAGSITDDPGHESQPAGCGIAGACQLRRDR